MYEKNLKSDLRLRLSNNDMDFLIEQSKKRGCTVSEVIRSIIGEYRRSLETLAIFKDALDLQKIKNGGQLSNGDTKTNLNDKL